jgi:hypothetical protein
LLDRPGLLLKLEEAAILIAVIVAYHHFHFSWLLFAVLFLAPDLSMVGFLANPRLGAALYNLGHLLAVPTAIFLAAYSGRDPLWMAIAIIWAAHIAFDRVFGYGLKYPTFFKDTHLQRIG